jgi:hypothetical protein
MASANPHEINRVLRYARASLCILAFILASESRTPLLANDPPPDLLRCAARKESENQAARSQYLYRQTVIVQDFSPRGRPGGEYREVREVIFSPSGERTERLVGKPVSNLLWLKLTDEDFRDIREVQPALITAETLFLYESKYGGEEDAEGAPCWVFRIRPRQILEGQRLFDGLIWINQRDDSIVRLQGQAVPQIVTTKSENLFPHFTTVRTKIDGKHWFPAYTAADDILPFRTGPQRIRLTIRYENYKRFTAESSIEYK